MPADVLLQGIKKALESKCISTISTCGGILYRQQPVTVMFKDASATEWSGTSVSFPGCTSIDILALAGACKAAVFAYSPTQVVIHSFGRAMELDPTNFFVNFDPAEHRILASIHKLSCPASDSLTVALTKLSIFGPGDFMKAEHVVNKNSNVVGLLLVCLSEAEHGGQLVVHHNKCSSKYEWHGHGKDSNYIQWAFIKDARYELLQVRSGHCVILSYDVLAAPAAVPSSCSVDLKTSVFAKALSTALDSRHFLTEGGRLGFSCSLCPHTANGFGKHMLSAKDQVMLATAKQLKLKRSIQPVWMSHEEMCELESGGSDCDCSKCATAAGRVSSTYAIGGNFKLQKCQWLNVDAVDAHRQLPKSYGAKPADTVYWVQKDFKFQLGLVGMSRDECISFRHDPIIRSAMRNMWDFVPCVNEMYSAPAIIVDVPPAHIRFQQK